MGDEETWHTATSRRVRPLHRSPQPSLRCAGDAPCRWATPRPFAAAVHAQLRRLAHSPLLTPLWLHLTAWRASIAPSPPPLIACAGLGNVSRSGASGAPLVQLACLLLLRRAAAALWRGAPAPPLAQLCAPLAVDGKVEGDEDEDEEVEVEGAPLPLCIHDPLFSPADVALLGALGLPAAAAPAPLKPAGDGTPTLFFLPHCPAAVAGAALAQHSWRCCAKAGSEGAEERVEEEGAAAVARPPLHTSCFVGNSFSAYVESRLRGALPPPLLPPWTEARRAAALGAAAEGEALPPVGGDVVVGAVGWARGTGGGGGGAARACGCRRRIAETCLETPLREAARSDGGAAALSTALSSTSVCTFAAFCEE